MDARKTKFIENLYKRVLPYDGDENIDLMSVAYIEAYMKGWVDSVNLRYEGFDADQKSNYSMFRDVPLCKYIHSWPQSSRNFDLKKKKQEFTEKVSSMVWFED